MSRLFRHPWGWATVAPLACAVHCALTPIVVVAAPSLAPGEAVEWALLAITVVVGSLALWVGARAHDDLRPVVPVTLGLGLWALSLGHAFRPVPEELTTVLATLVVAGGLFWNSRLHCARREAACRVCATGVETPGADTTPASTAAGTPAAGSA
jgi:hypothetical protein